MSRLHLSTSPAPPPQGRHGSRGSRGERARSRGGAAAQERGRGGHGLCAGGQRNHVPPHPRAHSNEGVAEGRKAGCKLCLARGVLHRMLSGLLSASCHVTASSAQLLAFQARPQSACRQKGAFSQMQVSASKHGHFFLQIWTSAFLLMQGIKNRRSQQHNWQTAHTFTCPKSRNTVSELRSEMVMLHLTALSKQHAPPAPRFLTQGSKCPARAAGAGIAA